MTRHGPVATKHDHRLPGGPPHHDQQAPRLPATPTDREFLMTRASSAAPRLASGDRDFDLIVVGAGIAGLAAAFYWLAEVDRQARILILERSGRLGGPAIQHRFEVDGRRLISPGGAQDLTFPSSFAPEVTSALTALGIDLSRFHSAVAPGHYSARGAGGHGFAFASSVWGGSHLATVQRSAADFAGAPVSRRTVAQINDLFNNPTDWLAGRTDDEKLAELRGRSCAGLLRDFASLDEDTHRFLLHSTAAQSGMTFDQHPALDGTLVGYQGMNGIELSASGDPWKGLTTTGTRFFPHMDPPIFRFPDGNATIARALAHHLVPGLFDAATADERLAAGMASEALDRPSGQVRIRLRCTAVSLRNHDGHVRVDAEIPGGGITSYRAGAAVVATPAHVAAQLVPDLDEPRLATAARLGRYPIVSASVALRDWRAWQALGISRLSWPGHATWQTASLEFPVTMGGSQPSPSPDEPTTATVLGCLTAPGSPAAEGADTGRRRLAGNAGPALAAGLKRLLAEALAPGGFDVDRDVADVRVEIWPHGYARCSSSRDTPGDGGVTYEARQQLAAGVGRIALAGVDVIDHPFLDGAMESARLAVARLAAR
jgi:spermidine dehydrogenase